jgi:hypothetical protein
LPDNRFDGHKVSTSWDIVLTHARRMGVHFELDSGRRTMAEQWQLVREKGLWSPRNPHGAAKPVPWAPHASRRRQVTDDEVQRQGVARPVAATARLPREASRLLAPPPRRQARRALASPRRAGAGDDRQAQAAARPAPFKPLEGLDWAWGHANITELKRAGIHFACRYLSHDASKNLTRAEATALSKAGIACVVVWETTANRAGAGRQAGVSDAIVAAEQAKQCGKPGSAPIYFAVDFDADPARVRTSTSAASTA